MVSLATHRLYAFAVFLLRDFFALSPFDRLFQWKAQATMVLSQLFLAAAAVFGTSVALGHLVVIAQSKSTFVVFGGVIAVVLALANGQAERRLLPRFEHQYRLLTRTQRIIGTIIVLLGIALTFTAALLCAVAARGLR
jgi:hypothetical protein